MHRRRQLTLQPWRQLIQPALFEPAHTLLAILQVILPVTCRAIRPVIRLLTLQAGPFQVTLRAIPLAILLAIHLAIP